MPFVALDSGPQGEATGESLLVQASSYNIEWTVVCYGAVHRSSGERRKASAYLRLTARAVRGTVERSKYAEKPDGSSTQTFARLRDKVGGRSRAVLQHPHGSGAVFAPPAVREAAPTHPRSTLAQVSARAVGRSVYRNVLRTGINDVAGRVDVVPHPGNVVLPIPDVVAPW